MSFYGDWLRTQGNPEDENPFLQQFLDYSLESMKVLIKGEKADVVEAIKVLLSVPMTRFLDTITHTYPFSSKDIFQYSNLEDATDTLCNILEYEKASLSYEEAGKLLAHASQQYACIKYGENHAKTAAMLTFVLIERDPNRRCNMVRISSLGGVSTMLSVEDKKELIKRLAIRNPFVKSLIYNAKKSETSYFEAASTVLSGQTIVRRKHNNEIIMNLILEDDPLKNRIRWQLWDTKV